MFWNTLLGVFYQIRGGECVVLKTIVLGIREAAMILANIVKESTEIRILYSCQLLLIVGMIRKRRFLL